MARIRRPQHNDSQEYPPSPSGVKTGRSNVTPVSQNVTLVSRTEPLPTRLEWVAHPRDRYLSDVTGDPMVTEKQTLTIRDNRSGEEYEVEITDGSIRAADLGRIGQTEDNPGLSVYDPGFTNTASTRSSVTYIDGDRGILEYRGYPIEQLAE